MITRESYEIYFMDYMDGNLAERERAEVEAFLLVHPDLREQLDGMSEVRLKVSTEVFRKKEQIKQSDSVLFRFLIIFIVPFVETR